MRSTTATLITAALLLGAAACSGTEEGSAGVDGAGGAPTGTGFDADWSTGGGAGAAEVADGALTLMIDNDANPYVVAESTHSAGFSDSTMTVSASKLDGSENVGMGVMCRVTDAGGYSFDVTPDGGDARIVRYADGEQTVLAKTDGVAFDPSDVEIGARCTGASLTLTVDGADVLTASDGTFTTGLVGVAAGGTGSGTSVVRFESLSLDG